MPELPQPQHPIYASLIAPAHPCDRHALLHAMERQLSGLKEPCPRLHARVQCFVDRGVPYFAPADAHYREWAERAAQLWDELQQRAVVDPPSSQRSLPPEGAVRRRTGRAGSVARSLTQFR